MLRIDFSKKSINRDAN